MEQPNAAPAGKKMNGGFIVVILLILAGGYWLATRPKTPADGQPSTTPSPAASPDGAMEKADVLSAIDVRSSDISFDFDSKLHDGSGRFTKYTAQGEFDRRDWTALKAELVIDTASIDTGIAVRDTHLKSGDFFSVEEYPTLVYKVTKAEVDEGKLQFTITGDLTMRGVTKPVTAPVSVLENSDGSVTLKGSLAINRRQWGDFKYDKSNPINPIEDQIPIHLTLLFR